MDATSPTVVDETSIRYEGWRIVAMCFVLATFGWAFGFYGQSLFLAELHRLHGWPTSLISTATSCYYLLGAVLVAFVSDAIRMMGPRNCLLAGVAMMAGSAALIGQVTAPWQLYAVDALMAFGWAGTSLGIITNTIGLWFDRKRGMAISLALNGASCGGVIGVPLLALAASALGFSNAMLIAAALMLAVLLPLVLATVGAPPKPLAAARADNSLTATAMRARAFRDVSFLTVTIAFALALFAQVGFIVHLVTFLDPLMGRERAAAAISLMTAMAVVGRVLFSTVIDRLPQRPASALSFLSQTVALAIVINSRSEPILFFGCALFGFSVGNLITLPALIVQREFDPRAFGVLISLITAINQVTYAFGPGIVGWLRDASGSYAVPFYGCMALQVVGAALVLVRRRADASDCPDRAGA